MHNIKYETKCIALNEHGEIVTYIAKISKNSFFMSDVGLVKVLCLKSHPSSKSNFKKQIILTVEAVQDALQRGIRAKELLRNYNEQLGIINVGDTVNHSLFGNGKVLSTSGEGNNESVRVRFPGGKIKSLLIKYSNLRLIND